MRGMSKAGARWGVGLAAIVAVIVAVARLVRGDGVAFLEERPPASWIVFPLPPSAEGMPSVPLVARFRKSFELPSAVSHARLTLLALREARVTANGVEITPISGSSNWRDESTFDLVPFLRPGRNIVELAVSNDKGPPAVWATLETGKGRFVTDGSWDVSLAGSAAKPSRVASDAPSDLGASLGLTPRLSLRALGDSALLLAVLMGVSALLALAWRHPAREPHGHGGRAWTSRWGPVLLAGAAWTSVLVHDAGFIPLGTGFDASGHLQYIRIIQEKRQLPDAREGWQAYQPPLYYILAAGADSVAGEAAHPASAGLPVKGLGVALAWLTLLAVAAALSEIFRANSASRVAGVLVLSGGGILLYLFQFPTNEALLVALSAVASYFTLRALREDEPPRRASAIAGAATGFALLAKSSALLLVPASILALSWKAAAAPPRSRRAEWGNLAIWAAMVFLVSGWFYIRAWVRHGSPLVTNLDLFPHWQQPGYRTALDYLRFGRGVTDPIFAGFSGFLDSLYSTTWGDGLASGTVSASLMPWSPTLLPLAYALALVPSVAVVVGAAVFTWRWVRSPDPRGAYLVALAALALVALVAWSLQVPFFSTKAFYGFAALVPFIAFAGEGVTVLMGKRPLMRVLVGFLVTAWALVSIAAAWITPGDPVVATALGRQWGSKGDTHREVAALRQAIERDPDTWAARVSLAEALLRTPGNLEDPFRLLQPWDRLPATAARYSAMGLLAIRSGDLSRAWAYLDDAVHLDPNHLQARIRFATVEEALGDRERATRAWQEVLAVDPTSKIAHGRLSELLGLSGDIAGAAEHGSYSARFR